jgi:hypothetical protein
VLEQALGELRAREMTLDVTNSAPLDGLLQLFDFLNDHFEANPDMVRLLANENIERELSHPLGCDPRDVLARPWRHRRIAGAR